VPVGGYKAPDSVFTARVRSRGVRAEAGRSRRYAASIDNAPTEGVPDGQKAATAAGNHAAATAL